MNDWYRLNMQAKMYKELYPAGTRIELEYMGNDPRPIDPGTRGVVRIVDSMGTIHCDFDNGRHLGLIPGEDSFRKLTAAELEEEKRNKPSLDNMIAAAESKRNLQMQQHESISISKGQGPER